MLSGFNPRSLVSAIPALVIAGNALDRFLAVAIVGFLLLGLVARVIHWLRFRWGFDGRVLHVHSGLLWRSRRAVDVARIQQVELERPLLHRVLGTALLRVETAADAGETEVALNGLAAVTARRLREDITTARRRRAHDIGAAPVGDPADTTDPQDAPVGATHPAPPTVQVCRPSPGDLVKHAVTGTGLLVVPAGIAALLQFGWETLDLAGNDVEEVADSAVGAATGAGIVAFAVLFVTIGLLGAVATTLVRDWDLELVRQGGDFRLSRGLLSQRSATVPIHRLQVLEYHQNWFRALFDRGTLTLRSAGGGATDQDRRITVPWVSRDDLVRVLSMGLGRVLDDPEDLPLEGRRHPHHARRRLWFLWLRGTWMPLLIAGLVALLVLDATTTVLAVLAVALGVTGALSIVLGSAQYRRLGHEATDRVLLVTGGIVGHRSTWMPLGRLQGVEGHANPFQRRLDLVTVVLRPAGGANQPVQIRDVDDARADELGTHFVAVAAGRVGPVDEVGPDVARTGGPGAAPTAGPPMAPA